MMVPTSAGSAVQVAVALGIALIAAPIIRNLTSDLNGSVGRAWPFSLTRCAAVETPGCVNAVLRSAGSQRAAPARMGRL